MKNIRGLKKGIFLGVTVALILKGVDVFSSIFEYVIKVRLFAEFFAFMVTSLLWFTIISLFPEVLPNLNNGKPIFSNKKLIWFWISIILFLFLLLFLQDVQQGNWANLHLPLNF